MPRYRIVHTTRYAFDEVSASCELEARLDAETPIEEKAESEKVEDKLSAAGGAPEGLPPEIKLALDDPEAGTPKLTAQAKLDDPRFDGLGTGNGAGGPNAGMDGVASASGEPGAAPPAPLKDVFAGQDKPAEGGDDGTEPDREEAPEGGADADGVSKQLADLGFSQTAQDAIVAPEGQSDPKAGSTGTLRLAGLEFGDLPKDIQAVLEKSTATEATLQFLDKVESGPSPSAETPGPGLKQAIKDGHVPDWPPPSEKDRTVMADLTAAYGADRPPRADGTMFLALLAHVAGEDMAQEPAEPSGDESP